MDIYSSQSKSLDFQAHFPTFSLYLLTWGRAGRGVNSDSGALAALARPGILCECVFTCACLCACVRACVCPRTHVCPLVPPPPRPSRPAGPHSSQRRHLVNLPAPPRSRGCRADLRSDVGATGDCCCFTGCGRCPHGSQSGGLADVCARFGPAITCSQPLPPGRPHATSLVRRPFSCVCKIALGDLTKRQLRRGFGGQKHTCMLRGVTGETAPDSCPLDTWDGYNTDPGAPAGSPSRAGHVACTGLLRSL